MTGYRSRVSDMTSTNDRFYEDLPTFDDFEGVIDFAAYTPVSDDWVLVMSDVVDSTAAIRAGRYKDVNMVGAATITAVLNACETTQVPFVFGGDGGTLVVPGSLREKACDALLDLQGGSVALYDLELRVDAVPVSMIRERGQDVSVRKFTLSPGNHLAILAGGGAELADDLVKDPAPDNPWLLRAETEREPPDLEGLSCRWQPLNSRDGQMMTLMVKGLDRDSEAEAALLRRVLDNIVRILGHDLTNSAPCGFAFLPPAPTAKPVVSLAADRSGAGLV